MFEKDPEALAKRVRDYINVMPVPVPVEAGTISEILKREGEKKLAEHIARTSRLFNSNIPSVKPLLSVDKPPIQSEAPSKDWMAKVHKMFPSHYPPTTEEVLGLPLYQPDWGNTPMSDLEKYFKQFIVDHL